MLSNNRLSGYTYDAAGNMINDGIHNYQIDAENQITTVDGGAATYTPGANGQRVRKQAAGVSVDYVHFNGEVLNEWNGYSDWSDYIYAGGKRIARADNYEDRIRVQGTNCANCGWQYTAANMHTGSNFTLNGYVIKAGDQLLVRQYQPTGVEGGVGIYFTDGSSTWDYALVDQDGHDGIQDTTFNTWHARRFDLTPFAGKTIYIVLTITEGNTQPGPWSIYYQDFVLLGADGTVHKIYSRDQSVISDLWGTDSVTGRSVTVEHAPSLGNVSGQTTTYYHGDHLGSSRLLSSADGYPTWQGTYYPYGAEYTPPGSTENTATPNHYKFTGKERDAESGLDYFGARVYSSVAGRFISPDPPLLDQTPGNPQSWNLYSYVRNNPLNSTDPTGNTCSDGSDKGPNGQSKCDGGGSSESAPANSSPPPEAQKQNGAAATKRYNTMDDAARAAEKAALAATDKSGRKYEYGGWILKNGKRQYTYTIPVTQGKQRGFSQDNVTIPRGFTGVADYLTHPHIDKAEGEGFSAGDEDHANYYRRTGYEADTYSRNLYRFTPGVTEFKKNEWCCGDIGDFVAHIPK